MTRPTHPGMRALAKAVPVGDCLEFRGKLHKAGYGVTSKTEDGKTVAVLAHRAVYEYAVGPIPEGLWILHSCDNPPCVNPEHLRPGTPKDNTDDMHSRGRGRKPRNDRPLCINGHPLVGQNRMERPRRNREGVKIVCRTCHRRSVAMAKGYDPDLIGVGNKFKTHCKHGHEFTHENTYIKPGTGARDCRTCAREREQRRVR